MFLTKDEHGQLKELSKDAESYQKIIEILNRKENLYRRVVETSTDLILRLDYEGHVLYVNPAVRQLLDLPMETILGNTLELWGLPPQVKQSFRSARHSVFQTAKEAVSEFSFRLDEQTYIYQTQIIPEFDYEGNIETVVVIARDISKRKRAEADLQRYKIWLNEAQEVSGVGSWETNLDTGETVWSDEFFRICGLEPHSAEPSSELGFTFIHPDDRERAGAAVQQSIEDNKPYFIEKRIVRPNGEIIWVESRGEIIVDEASQTRKLIGTFLNISERKNAEIALQLSEERHRTVLSTMDEGVILQDDRGGMLMCNDATIEIFGLSREELFRRFGKPSQWDIIAENGEPFPSDQLPGLLSLQTGEPQSNIILGIDHAIRQERRWLRINTHPLKDENSAKPYGVVMTINDVTDERQANASRLQIAIETERNRLLSQFIQMASHEFRTPLSVIKNNAYLLSRLQLNDKSQEKIAQINQRVDQIDTLLSMQLLLTKLDSGIPMHCHSLTLKLIIGDLQTQFGAKLNQKNIALHTEINPESLTVPADDNYLRKALEQLLDNAIRYSQENSEIQIYAYQTHEKIVLCVKDQGLGIEADDLPVIFDRFWRKDKMQADAGLGLGLSLVQKIVHLHHGDIEVDSTINTGSEFRIILPA